MASLADISNFINTASSQAAAWYSAVSNKPVIVPGNTASQYAALAASQQLQTQQRLSQQSPALAQILSPQTLLLILLAIVLIFGIGFLFTRK